MDMKNFIVALLLVTLVGGGYWWWQNKNTIPETAPADTSSSNSRLPDGAVMEDGMIPDDTTGVDTSSAAPMSATITYNGTSYSPSEVTIKKGGTVHWTNTSNEGMWVASAQHPSHTVYSGTTRQEHCPDTSGTAFDQCVSGNSFSFTFEKVGTWSFHNHLNASAWGKVVVVE